MFPVNYLWLHYNDFLIRNDDQDCVGGYVLEICLLKKYNI